MPQYATRQVLNDDVATTGQFGDDLTQPLTGPKPTPDGFNRRVQLSSQIVDQLSHGHLLHESLSVIEQQALPREASFPETIKAAMTAHDLAFWKTNDEYAPDIS